MIGYETWAAVTAVLATASNTVDAGDLEGWLECFDKKSLYHVLSRENYERNLPLTLFQCDNKNMMRDRVLPLREANVVNIHRDQHVCGMPEIVALDDGTFGVTSGYAVYQTDQDGFSRLFAVGAYRDVVAVTGGVAHFKARCAIVDTYAIQNMLSTPN